MASALIKQRDYKHIAEKYSELNEFQVNQGKIFLKLLGVKRGDKVADMGCGTGELTSSITDQVGDEGEVLGVDPDEDRIKVAVQMHCGVKRNIKFMVGDSSSPFSHYNEEYYDVHFSNFVFHWLAAQEKDVFLKTAFNCLKPGGRIAILYPEKDSELLFHIEELLPDDEIEKNRPPDNCIERSVAQSLLEKSGFVIISCEYTKEGFMFPSLDTFITWYYSSAYVDESKIVAHKKEAFAKKFVNEDGKIYFEDEINVIIATKKIYNSYNAGTSNLK